MAIYQLGDDCPRLDERAWVAETASVIGKVTLGAGATVWYGAVVRADNDRITIGAGTSIQDGCILHADPGVPLTLGERCTVGHQAMLHGCTVGDGTLIGIQAVVLNHARIGRGCIVGAGAIVTEGKEFPDGSLILGSPARVVRTLTPEQAAGLPSMAQRYVENGARHRAGLRRVDAPVV